MAARGTWSLMFIIDVTAGESDGINSEVYRASLSASDSDHNSDHNAELIHYGVSRQNNKKCVTVKTLTNQTSTKLDVIVTRTVLVRFAFFTCCLSELCFIMI